MASPTRQPWPARPASHGQPDPPIMADEGGGPWPARPVNHAIANSHVDLSTANKAVLWNKAALCCGIKQPCLKRLGFLDLASQNFATTVIPCFSQKAQPLCGNGRPLMAKEKRGNGEAALAKVCFMDKERRGKGGQRFVVQPEKGKTKVGKGGP